MPAASDSPLDEAQRAVDTNPRDAAAWHRLGLAQQNLANRGDAIQAFSKAASIERGVARYHHDLGNALIEDGNVDRAITSYRRALRIDDSQAEVHNDLGTAYFEKNWQAEAEACFRRAVELKPDHGVAHANLGAALRAQGRLQEGRREYQRALFLRIRSLLPRFLQRQAGKTVATAAPPVSSDARQANAHYSAGCALADANDFAAALGCADAAIALQPDQVEFQVLRARALLNLGRPGEALQAATRAVRLDPESADAYGVLSGALRPTRPAPAEQAARRAVEIDATSHSAHAHLAASLSVLGRSGEAEEHAREALRLAPAEPFYPLNLAIILKDAGKLDEARALYRAQGKTVPNHAHAMLNMGTLALECEADLDAARSWYAKGLALRNDPHLALSDSIVDLLDGRFGTAWPKYESRKLVPSHIARHALYAGFQTWDASPLPARRLLVYGEQGLGDEVMFASIYGELSSLALQLTLVCDTRLESIFRRSFPGADVLPAKPGTVPEMAQAPDRVAACGSLGQYLRRSAGDFPVRRGYLIPDAAKAGQWTERLRQLGPGRKIGVSWVGGTPTTGRTRRSLSLQQLRPLLEIPGTSWISLQHGDSANAGPNLHVFPGVTEDMDDLASLMQALDVVVSVCNTNVHLAGAIGKEVLVMAPHVPEWRYGLRGERMLWYPSARVFRQRTFGDWDSVISAVKARLQS